MAPQPGPNESLIGREYAADLATPALLLDLDAFEANLAAMAAFAQRAGVGLRPHVKAHKSTAIARRQLAAGAVGLCCATVREVEVMAGAGLAGVLLTTPVGSASAVRRVIAAHERVGDLSVVVDGVEGAELLARHAPAGSPITVLVELDMGQRRTGATSPADAVAIACKIAGHRHLIFGGVQAYYGHLQHVTPFEDRRARVAEMGVRLDTFLAALAGAGVPARIVSGGGTGTHQLDAAGGRFTEIQPGSYIFMDKQYGAVDPGPQGQQFRSSLTVAGRVVSVAQSDRVIVDAGTKSMSTDAGPALVATPYASATHAFMGDEHGAVILANTAARPAFGDLITFVPPHCDPTVNLHDRFHVVRDGVLVEVWPIEARGY